MGGRYINNECVHKIRHKIREIYYSMLFAHPIFHSSECVETFGHDRTWLNSLISKFQLKSAKRVNPWHFIFFEVHMIKEKIAANGSLDDLFYV